MQPEAFLDLFCKELALHAEMQDYYKFLVADSRQAFRKNYFLERLRYIKAQVVDSGKKDVIDIGCGYGTTCLYLAMNGIRTQGTTLEFYFEAIQKRKEYWSRFGDTSLFEVRYENLFDSPPPAESFDFVIVQDTLHHLEPIDAALSLMSAALRPGGKLVAIEENGSNLIQRAKLYKYRGNRRIVTFRDERLQKDILMGNENIRSLREWFRLFSVAGLKSVPEAVQYIRYYLPFSYRYANADRLLERERSLQKRNSFRREYLFFGINFVGQK